MAEGISLTAVAEHVLRTSYPYSSQYTLFRTTDYGGTYAGGVYIAFDDDIEYIDKFAEKLYEVTEVLFGRPCTLYAYRGRTIMKKEDPNDKPKPT